MKRVVLLTLGAMLCAGVAAADKIALYPPYGDPCIATPAAPYKVYVVHLQEGSEEGPTGSHWALDDQTGQVHTGYTAPPGFTAFGDPWTGSISVGYGDCRSGDFVILELNYSGQPQPAQPCGKLRLIGPRDGRCGGLPGVCYEDCNFNSLGAIGSCAAFNRESDCYIDPPSNPSPPDGATNVPLCPQLNWAIDPHVDVCGCGITLSRKESIYFGETPDPPLLISDAYPIPFDICRLTGALQPETVYYWRIRHSEQGYYADGPVWSFRTASSVPVEQSTWGGIKALYR